MSSLQPMFEEIISNSKISSEQKLAVKAWWKAFYKDQEKISNSFDTTTKNSIDIPVWMDKYLNPIDKGIMWEFGPGIRKSHRLMITSENNKLLRPLIRYILNQAPDYINWEFYEYRLAENLANTQETMTCRTNWQDISEIEFELVQEEFNTIGINYCLPSSLYEETKKFHSYNSYVLTESLLGEEILDKWVDYIDVHVKPKKKFFRQSENSAHPLSNLREAFLNKIETIKSRLPQSPYFQIINDGDIKWCGFEATPLEQDQYPKKQDLYVSTFIFVEGDLFNATYFGCDRFSSERFSNQNEIFIYLKMDGAADDLNQDIFIDRTTMEDMLNEPLQKEKAGCVIGGGTGLRYSYIDFAIVDFHNAIKIIQKILQKGKLTKSSWILFHDAIYQSQWIGIWGDSPAPSL